MGRILAIIVSIGLLPLEASDNTRTVDAVVTAYCPCKKCCGPNARGITSTGTDARRLPGCAVDPKMIPYGSRVNIPGIGWRTADDTGGAMRASGRRGVFHIDVRMRTHKEAVRFGVKHVKVRIAAPIGAGWPLRRDSGVVQISEQGEMHLLTFTYDTAQGMLVNSTYSDNYNHSRNNLTLRR